MLCFIAKFKIESLKWSNTTKVTYRPTCIFESILHYNVLQFAGKCSHCMLLQFYLTVIVIWTLYYRKRFNTRWTPPPFYISLLGGNNEFQYWGDENFKGRKFNTGIIHFESLQFDVKREKTSNRETLYEVSTVFRVYISCTYCSVMLCIRGLTIKFANSPPCACRSSSGQKPQYGSMTLAYQVYHLKLLKRLR
jgi:hypothetical protein